MNANAVPLLAIFEKKLRLEVPLFQRQYVWNQEHQWEPLWEDIERKFSEYVNGRVVYILSRLNETYLSNKMEQIVINGSVTVEHLLPQQWIEHWPLQNGSRGLDYADLYSAEANGNPLAEATRRRHSALQTFGNLTLLTQSLNSSVSNGPWATKKHEVLRSSLLPMNQQLHDADIWDEEAIHRRSVDLFQRALSIWPRG